MPVNYTPSHIYLDYSEDAVSVLNHHLLSGLRSRGNTKPVPIYFRADDIGVLSQSFNKLLDLFAHFKVPLNLAVVPGWLTPARWAAISRICSPSDSLWCWHQHGWLHRNHQSSGKKCEFGSDRSADDIEMDLHKGKKRLIDIMGPCFSPYFTPPWNRCSDVTLTLLVQGGFQAISTDRPHDNNMSELPDIPVNVDLHTRRESDTVGCLHALAAELEAAAQLGRIGIMIHHQRMNDNSFALLSGLLECITGSPDLAPVRFNEFT